MKYFKSFLEASAPKQPPVKWRECYSRDLYDPVAARAYALSDETLMAEQRANLLHYAHENEMLRLRELNCRDGKTADK